MSLVDSTAPDEAAARDGLRHDLISLLTTISGRAQLLGRMIQRSAASCGHVASCDTLYF